MFPPAPEWLITEVCHAKRGQGAERIEHTRSLLASFKLSTVCETAECPNRGECFSNGTATFLILGDICTRGCAFCAVYRGRPWLKDYATPNLSPRTTEGYETIVRCHLIPKLGGITLTQLKPERIQRYYSDMLSSGRYDGSGSLNAVTVRQHHAVLHRALHFAMKWGLISRNPADAIDLPRCQHHEMRIMNEGDIHGFLELAKTTQYYPLFYLALYTGVRRSELLALRWCDMDLIMGQMSINRSLHHLRDKSLVFRTPKTAKGRRSIALPPSAVIVLREHKEHQDALRQEIGLSLTDDALVFPNLDGKPLLPDTISHAWTKLAARSGLAGIRLHDARHTHATILLKQGIHPKVVQERLGHANISMTLDVYSHVVPGLQEAAAKRFDELMTFEREKETVKNFG